MTIIAQEKEVKMTEKTKPISLSDLIYWVKQELLSEEARKNDPVPLFAIDEITVEINFIVEGTVKGGFSALTIVEAGSEVSEQRVQKATIKMAPILDRAMVIDELVASNPEIVEVVKSESVKAILKGKTKTKKTAPAR
jgi:hypothetical protein